METTPTSVTEEEIQGRDAEREARFQEKVLRYDRRLFRENLLVALAVFAVALVAYSFMLVPFAVPGPSADTLASALGLRGGLATRHLVWRRILGAVLAGSSPEGAIWSANALCLVFSALGVSLVYLVLSQLVLLFFDYEHFELALGRDPTRRLGLAAGAGGLAAAAALLFCAPYWSVAAQVRPDPFYLCWLLLSALALLRFGATGGLPWLFAFGAIHALGLSQTSCFWGWAPVFYLYALFVAWSADKLRWQTAAAFLVLTAACFGLAFRQDILSVMSSDAWSLIPATDTPTAGKLAKNAMRALVTGIWGSVPRAYWLILLGLCVAPCLAALVVARRALNGEHDVAMLALHATMAVVTVLVLLDPPFSPWQLYGGESLQILPHAMTAFALGYLVVWADAALLLRDPEGGAVPRGILAAAAPALLLFAAFHNADDANPRRVRFAVRYADAVLDGLRGRTHLVTEDFGTYDSTLLLRARERGIPLDVPIDLSRPGDTRLLDDVCRSLPTVRLANVARVDYMSLLKHWIPRRAEAGSELALSVYPDLWYTGPFEAVPSGLVFIGEAPGASVPGETEGADFIALADAFAPEFDAVPEDDFGWRRRLVHFARRQVALAGNNLAFRLERAGRTEEAFALYRRIHELLPEHVPALLNWATLVRTGLHPEDTDAVRAAFGKLQKDVQERRHPELGYLAVRDGYVSDPAAYAVAGWNWARSGEPRLAAIALRDAAERVGPEQQSALLGILAEMHFASGDAEASERTWLEILEEDPGDNRALLGLVSLCITGGRLDEAREWLAKARVAGVPEASLLRMEAVAALASGDIAAARDAAGSLRALAPASVEVPMILAQVETALFRGAKTEAEREASLAALRSHVAALSEKLGADALPVLLASGECKTLEERWEDARQDYFSAIAKMEPGNRALPLALSHILDLDFRLADKDAARVHAREILARSPDNPFANYVLGSLALEKERYESAEDYLLHAREGAPDAYFVVNDLAVAQQALHRLDRAERTAREAVAVAPDEYAPHDTLGGILLEKGDAAAAMAEFEKAQKIYGADPRVDLHIAVAALRLGDVERARRTYESLRGDEESFTGPDARAWLALGRDLADAK